MQPQLGRRALTPQDLCLDINVGSNSVRQIPANTNQPGMNPNERKDRQQPPQPTGRPVPPNYQQQENRQNPPQMSQPDHGRQNDQQRQVRPDNPNRDRPNRPGPPNNQQQPRLNN